MSAAQSPVSRFLERFIPRKPRSSWQAPEQSTGKFYRQVGPGLYCWEAIGPARAQFETFAGSLKSHISKAVEPYPEGIVIEFCMMGGRSKDSLQPVVTISGPGIGASANGKEKRRRKAVRQTVRGAIRDSKILDNYPGIGIVDDDCSPIAGPMKQRSSSPAKSTDGSDTPAQGHTISLRPTPYAFTSQLELRSQAAGLIKATGGGLLYHGSKAYIVTTSHTFDVAPHEDSLSEADSCGFDFDGYRDLLGGEDEFVAITSEGSMTSNDSKGEEYSQTSGSENASPTPEYLLQAETRQAYSYEQESSERDYIEVPAAIDLPSIHEPSVHELSIHEPSIHDSTSRPLALGPLAFSSSLGPRPGLDYAVIEVPEEVLSSLKQRWSSVKSDSLVYPGAPAERVADGAEVMAITGTGRILKGTLSGTPSLITQARGLETQEMWIAQLNDPLVDGDSGSWVFDPITGAWYGHLIAGSINSTTAYVAPAYQILRDLDDRFGGSFLPLKWSEVGDDATFSSRTSLVRPSKNEGLSAHPSRVLQWLAEVDSPESLTSLSDSHHAVQAFLGFIANHSETSVSWDDTHSRNIFVPHSTLKEYFSDEQGLDALLNEVLEAGRPDPDLITSVHRDYSMVFATLLSIGRGSLIASFVQDKALNDSMLPLTEEVDDLSSLLDQHSYKKFCEKQWMFCVPTLHYGENRELADNSILPFVGSSLIGRGAFAEVYKVTIHPGYNALQLESKKALGSVDRKPSVFALKRFAIRNDLHDYKSEFDALMKIQKKMKGTHSSKWLGVYGGFLHRGVYSMILDYADLGTLGDYFDNNAPPVTATGIYSFWESLSGTVKSIGHLHDLRNEEPILTRYHAHIKPSNILVFPAEGDAKHKVHFKLSDFGISLFTKPRTAPLNLVNRAEDVTFHSTGPGTRAYVAPECYPRGQVSSERDMSKSCDIWSLGCVLSASLAWVLGGHPALEVFRESNRSANIMHEAEGGAVCIARYDAAFAMKEKLDALMDNESNDPITSDVITIVRDMLAPEAFLPDAKTLGMRFQHLFDRHRSMQYGRASVPLSTAPVSYSDSMSDSLDSRSEGGSFWSDNDSANDSITEAASCAASTSVRFRSPLNPMLGGSEQRFEGPNHGPFAASVSVQRSSSQTPPLTSSPGNSADRWEQQKQGPLANGRYSTMLSTQSIAIPSSSIKPDPEKSFIGGNHHQGTEQDPSLQSPIDRIPHWSVEDAIAWRTEVKGRRPFSRSRTGVPRGKLLYEGLRWLNERDHVFVVDDSPSMRDHWKAVIDLVDFLAYMVKSGENDGVDLYFTVSGGKVTRKSSSSLTDHVKQRFPNAASNRQSNLEPVLDHILSDYKRKLTPTTARPRQLFIPRSKEKTRKMSIYVLTDGAWVPASDIEKPIRSLVDTLERIALPRDQVGISFIQFGNDPTGTSGLRHLDQFGADSAIDPIDVEPYEGGNVLKMLLGAIDLNLDG